MGIFYTPAETVEQLQDVRMRDTDPGFKAFVSSSTDVNNTVIDQGHYTSLTKEFFLLSRSQSPDSISRASYTSAYIYYTPPTSKVSTSWPVDHDPKRGGEYIRLPISRQSQLQHEIIKRRADPDRYEDYEQQIIMLWKILGRAEDEMEDEMLRESYEGGKRKGWERWTKRGGEASQYSTGCLRTEDLNNHL